jgi:hypothetical protein
MFVSWGLACSYVLRNPMNHHLHYKSPSPLNITVNKINSHIHKIYLNMIYHQLHSLPNVLLLSGFLIKKLYAFSVPIFDAAYGAQLTLPEFLI